MREIPFFELIIQINIILENIMDEFCSKWNTQ